MQVLIVSHRFKKKNRLIDQKKKKNLFLSISSILFALGINTYLFKKKKKNYCMFKYAKNCLLSNII